MFLRNELFFSITKNEHLHVRVNLELGMCKDVSGLRHMVLVVSGFLLVLFALKVNLDLGMRKDVSGLRHMVLVAHGLLLVVFALKVGFSLLGFLS